MVSGFFSGDRDLALIHHRLDADEIGAGAFQQIADHLAIGEDVPIGIGVAEPEIGVGVGEPYQASAAAVVDRGDEVDRLGGIGGGAGMDR